MLSVLQSDGYKNLWDAPNLLLQKIPAEEFTATAKVKIDERFEGERFGFVVMGLDYSYIGITDRNGKLLIAQVTAKNADKGLKETQGMSQPLTTNDVYLRVTMKTGAIGLFSYSSDGKNFTTIGESFKAREGRWIGAKIGFFFNRPGKFNDAGSADIDWIRFEK